MSTRPVEPEKKSKSARRGARERVVQILYAAAMSGNPLSLEAEYLAHFYEKEGTKQKIDQAYFTHVLEAFSTLGSLDAVFVPALDRPLERVTPIECAILRLATYELSYQHEIPYRVVMNEALELAKVFGAQESHKFINGVLDKIVRSLRPGE